MREGELGKEQSKQNRETNVGEFSGVKGGSSHKASGSV